MTRNPCAIAIIMSGDPYRPGIIWPWTVITPRLCGIDWTAVNRISMNRWWHNCCRYGRHCPDYRSCYGKWEEKWVVVMATSGLRIDYCQN
jgi:hypothetical protein